MWYTLTSLLVYNKIAQLFLEQLPSWNTAYLVIMDYFIQVT